MSLKPMQHQQGSLLLLSYYVQAPLGNHQQPTRQISSRFSTGNIFQPRDFILCVCYVLELSPSNRAWWLGCHTVKFLFV